MSKKENESTYSSRLKEDISEVQSRSACCRRALLAGLLYFRMPDENGVCGTLIEKLEREFSREFDSEKGDGIASFFRCEGCVFAFLRGLFLSVGTMTDPETEYRMEFPMPSCESADEIAELLAQVGTAPKRAVRRGKHILYYKESGAIEDLLGLMGAKKAAFDLMNIKIKREIRNNVNRQTNCDAANIKKTVSASGGQIEAIEYLKDQGHLESLPDELCTTALLRLEHPNISLAALAALHDEAISRSGVNHRLSRIVELASEIRSKENEKKT